MAVLEPVDALLENQHREGFKDVVDIRVDLEIKLKY